MVLEQIKGSIYREWTTDEEREENYGFNKGSRSITAADISNIINSDKVSPMGFVAFVKRDQEGDSYLSVERPSDIELGYAFPDFDDRTSNSFKTSNSFLSTVDVYLAERNLLLANASYSPSEPESLCGELYHENDESSEGEEK
ncbi:hypothetical protein ACFLZB_02245 [Nanoarchaeota archaeon]